jgi:ribose transport system substrate-binding protein
MANRVKSLRMLTVLLVALGVMVSGVLAASAQQTGGHVTLALAQATEAATPDPLAGIDFKGVKIGMSTLQLSNPFFVELTAGAKEEADKLGIQLVVTDSNDDANKQVSDLENFVSGGFQGFIVTAVDPTAISSVAKDALAKGMKVIAHTSDLGTDNQTALVWAVEHDMGVTLGQQAGEWANKHIAADGTLKLAILNYDTIPQVIHRREGIVDGIKEVYKGKMQVVGTVTSGDPTSGLKAGETWLQANPDLNMIVGINDGGALGAYQAVIAANLNDPSKFFVGGIDATGEALAAIKSGGAYQATVDQQPRAMGALCVRILALSLKGLPYEKVTAIKLAPVNASNVDQWLQKAATPAATAASK